MFRQTALGGSPRDVPLAAPLADQGVDSLALVEFVVALEKAFGIQIPETVWERARAITLEDFVDQVMASQAATSTGTRGLVSRVTSDSRMEWLVVASVLALLALAVVLGWIRVDLPRAP